MSLPPNPRGRKRRETSRVRRPPQRRTRASLGLPARAARHRSVDPSNNGPPRTSRRPARDHPDRLGVTERSRSRLTARSRVPPFTDRAPRADPLAAVPNRHP
jgi:hypothetical protein